MKKILIFSVFIATVWIINNILFPYFTGLKLISFPELSEIKIANTRPFLPLAKIICKLKGREMVELDFYDKLNGNPWVCTPPLVEPPTVPLPKWSK